MRFPFPLNLESDSVSTGIVHLAQDVVSRLCKLTALHDDASFKTSTSTFLKNLHPLPSKK